MGKCEADGVEGGQRRRALKREHGHPALPHEGAHVAPRQVGALAAHVGERVYRVVQDGDAEVGLAHLIDVRIAHAQVERPLLLLAGAPLVVEVAARMLHVGQERLEQVEKVLALGPHSGSSLLRSSEIRT